MKYLVSYVKSKKIDEKGPLGMSRYSYWTESFETNDFAEAVNEYTTACNECADVVLANVSDGQIIRQYSQRNNECVIAIR